MAKVKGVCKNIEDCSKALSREAQEVEKGAPFVCEECEKPLTKAGTPPPPPPRRKLLLIIIAIVLIGAGVGGYFAFFNKPAEKPEPPGDKGESTELLVETIQLTANTVDMLVGETHKLNAAFAPVNAASGDLQWSSNDESVATVADGKIVAVAEGNATVTVKDPKSGVSASCAVNVGKKTEPKPTNGGGTTTGDDKIDYGTWTGGTKNGKPHGTNVKFTFSKSHLIDRRCPKKRVANAGDYIIGEYDNGNLIQGRWYKTSGDVEGIIIGQTVSGD